MAARRVLLVPDAHPVRGVARELHGIAHDAAVRPGPLAVSHVVGLLSDRLHDVLLHDGRPGGHAAAERRAPGRAGGVRVPRARLLAHPVNQPAPRPGGPPPGRTPRSTVSRTPT